MKRLIRDDGESTGRRWEEKDGHLCLCRIGIGKATDVVVVAADFDEERTHLTEVNFINGLYWRRKDSDVRGNDASSIAYIDAMAVAVAVAAAIMVMFPPLLSLSSLSLVAGSTWRKEKIESIVKCTPRFGGKE